MGIEEGVVEAATASGETDCVSTADAELAGLLNNTVVGCTVED
jgi:hypothetical protein